MPSDTLDHLRAEVFAVDLSVHDVMSPVTHVLHPNNSLWDLTRILHDKDSRFVPVLDSNYKIQGMITHRELLAYSLSEAKRIAKPEREEWLRSVSIRESMNNIETYNVKYYEPELELRTAAIDMIEKRLGGVPVIDKEGQLCGVLMESDFVKLFYLDSSHLALVNHEVHQAFEKVRTKIDRAKCSVKDMMSPIRSFVNVDDDLLTVENLMRRDHVRHMPVLDSQKNLLGLITNRDLMANSLSTLVTNDPQQQDAHHASICVRDVMKTDLITTTPDTPLKTAACVLNNKNIGCLPVLQNGELVGIITDGDFTRFFADGL